MSDQINKYVEAFCPNCQMETVMIVMRKKENSDTYWLKCKQCSLFTMLEKDKLQQKNIRSFSKANTNEREKKRNQIKEYKPTEEYKIGQVIYHPQIKDQGIVVEKKPGSGDYDKIVVNFKNIGKKLLVQGISDGK